MVKIAELAKPEYGFTEKAARATGCQIHAASLISLREEHFVQMLLGSFGVTSKARDSMLRKQDILIARIRSYLRKDNDI